VEESSDVPRQLQWVYAVVTVPPRRGKLLPQTLASLKAGGFPAPVLCVDGADHREALSYEMEFGLPVLSRYPTIKTFGAFALTLAEIYIRNPHADRFAMFQDDFVCVRNLRQYLEACPYPDGKEGRSKGYWNCYLFNSEYKRCPRDRTVKQQRITGWYPSLQRGLGAVALVFNREAVWDLLSEKGHIVTRPAHAGVKSWRNIDGGIVDALKKQGYREHVHSPSLVQHMGIVSSMKSHRHPTAASFPGVDFDALDLLKVR